MKIDWAHLHLKGGGGTIRTGTITLLTWSDPSKQKLSLYILHAGSSFIDPTIFSRIKYFQSYMKNCLFYLYLSEYKNNFLAHFRNNAIP